MQNNKASLHGWLFTYNQYTDKWRASTRDNKDDLFSSYNSDDVLSSSDINTLIELIIKTQGNKDKLNTIKHG